MSDYPTDEQLRRIETWPADDPVGWFAFIRAAGKYWNEDPAWGWAEEFKREDLRMTGAYGSTSYHVSTAGWSGNEEILGAMVKNRPLWSDTWYSTRRGGHYVFEVRG
jgi:hypothetical protein